MNEVKFLRPELEPSIPLPEAFRYPPDYLRYLLFEERERHANADLRVLNWIWPSELHWVQRKTEEALAAFARRHPDRSHFFLVPFAEDAGDGIWFFSPNGIHFVDMGANWIPEAEDAQDFLEFVNRERKAAGLSVWTAEPQ